MRMCMRMCATLRQVAPYTHLLAVVRERLANEFVVSCTERRSTHQRCARERDSRVDPMASQDTPEQRACASIEGIEAEDIGAGAIDAVVREALVVLCQLYELARAAQ